MLDKLSTESAFLKIEALAAAAGFGGGGQQMSNPFFEVRNEAENALNASKAAREVLSMWLDLIPFGDDYEAEAIRAGVVITQIHEAITHLEKALAVNEE